jgi:hypothetical protein
MRSLAVLEDPPAGLEDLRGPATPREAGTLADLPISGFRAWSRLGQPRA